jgi:AcrR family transcriptional regulator
MPTIVSPVKPTRKERAQATRGRIAAAAYRLFAERGYQATTMGQIAAEAGVAVQTVHFVFHTKAALLQEVVARAVLGDAGPPEEQPWFRGLADLPDGRAVLATMVENTTPIIERVAPVAWVMHAVPDEEVAEVFRHNERLRRRGYGRVIEVLAERGWLRAGLSEERATDVLLLILGPETYGTLAGDYGWAPAEWRAWALDTLAGQLLSMP